MVSVVVGSRYSNILSRYTLQSRQSRKPSGIRLKVTLMVALYFVVPLCHWIWLQGGLQNQFVQVRYSHCDIRIKNKTNPFIFIENILR